LAIHLANVAAAPHNAWRQQPVENESKVMTYPPHPENQQPQPPGGYPAPGAYPPPAGQPQAGGLDKKTSAILSYVLGWLTGIIFLFVGKNDPDVKFHASQSIIFFGAASVLNVVLSVLGSALGSLGVIFSLAGLVIGVFVFVVWILALIQANKSGGARFELPVVGKFIAPYADQLANAVK
jgi:uncharacterized membrane protein